MAIDLSGLRAAKAAGLGLNDVLVLSAIQANACFDEELGRFADSAAWELAQQTDLTKNQVEHAISKLTKAGVIARRQMVKAAGVPAVSLLCALANSILGLEGRAGDLPADLDETLRTLAVGQCAAFRLAVSEAWAQSKPLAQGVSDAFAGKPAEFDRIESILRERALQAMEEVATEAKAQIVQEEQESAGLYTFECEDGKVIIDRRVLLESKAAPATIDLRFVRDVLLKVRAKRPGFVTRERLPELIAEAGYSRSLGFVSRHDAEQAERALSATMAKSSWSRPRGIRETFYSLIRSSVVSSQQGGEILGA